MSTTMGSASASETETYDEGAQIKGKDFIFLNAPAIDFPENAPLITEKRELYAILNELFQDEGGGGDEYEWQPPDWWLPVPEPQAYEIYLLVQVYEMSAANIAFVLTRPGDANSGYGNHTIDWGDGTSTNYEEANHWGSYHGHTYGDTGQYLIKITADKDSCFWQRTEGSYIMLIAKIGSKIILNNDFLTGVDYYDQFPFANQRRLHWVVINCENGGLPRRGVFTQCFSLKKVDMAVPPEVISYNTFYGCKCLTKFDFSNVITIDNQALEGAGFKKLELPKCTSIGEYAASNCYNLTSVNAPICDNAGKGAFSIDYALESATFSENCAYGNNCFENCYSLYPRPDGSGN